MKFCEEFPKERREKIFLGFFLFDFSSIFLSNFSFSFFPPKNSYFYNPFFLGGGGVFIGTPSHTLPLLPLVWLFRLFPSFWSDFHAIVWRSFRTLISSNFISLESSGCLVFIGSNFVRFGVTVIKIWRSEGRWHSARNSMTFFLENFIPSNPWQTSLSPFCER